MHIRNRVLEAIGRGTITILESGSMAFPRMIFAVACILF